MLLPVLSVFANMDNNNNSNNVYVDGKRLVSTKLRTQG